MTAASPAGSPGPALTDRRPDRMAAVLGLVDGEMSAVEVALRARMDSPIGAIPEVGAHLLQAGGNCVRAVSFSQM